MLITLADRCRETLVVTSTPKCHDRIVSALGDEGFQLRSESGSSHPRVRHLVFQPQRVGQFARPADLAPHRSLDHVKASWRERASAVQLSISRAAFGRLLPFMGKGG